MGDVAEMMLDGTLCEGCGVYLGEAEGYPCRCKQCQKDQRTDAIRTATHTYHRDKKTNCPQCGKRVKIAGLSDHIRVVHGVMSNVESTGARSESTLDDGLGAEPRRAVRLTLQLDADTIRDLDALEQIAMRVERDEMTTGCSGGYTSGTSTGD